MFRDMAVEDSNKTKKPPKEKNAKRVVWKPVFATPFSVKWPDIDSKNAEKLLQGLLKLFNGRPSTDGDFLSVSQYKNQLRCLKKRKRVQDKVNGTSVGKISAQGKKSLPVTPSLFDATAICPEKDVSLLDEIPRRPPILDELLLGINAIAKELESEIRQQGGMVFKEHLSNTPTTAASEPRPNQISLIFVCKEDLNPISLAEYLLTMVATLNQHRLMDDVPGLEYQASRDPVLLIPLLKGAEEQIAAALGIKNAAVIALRGNNAHISELNQLAKKHIKPILSPNLKIWQEEPQKKTSKASQNDRLDLIPTHVKFYKTTAPTDMRKHKSERLELKKQRKILKKRNLISDGNEEKNDNQKKNKRRRIDNH